jgi:hypothetical protein
LNYKKLKPSEFILVGTQSWNKFELKEIIRSKSVIDFNEDDNYTISFLKHFKLEPKLLPERHYINNTHQMLSFVEMGLGYAVFDSEHVKDKIKEKIFCNLAPKLKLTTEWYLCWSNLGAEMSPILKEVINKFD